AKAQDIPPGADIADVVVIDNVALFVRRQHTEGQTIYVAVRGQDKPLTVAQNFFQRIEECFTKLGPNIHNSAPHAPVRLTVRFFGPSRDLAPEIGDHVVDEVCLAEVDHLDVVRLTRKQDKNQIASRLPDRLSLGGYGFEVERIEPDELNEDSALGK